MFPGSRPRLPDLDEELEYLPAEDCARRMNISEERLRVLIGRGAVATRPDGWGGVLCRPTIVV